MFDAGSVTGQDPQESFDHPNCLLQTGRSSAHGKVGNVAKILAIGLSALGQQLACRNSVSGVCAGILSRCGESAGKLMRIQTCDLPA